MNLLNQLLNLKPEDYLNRNIPVKEILRWFKICDAYWMYSGDPKNPHAELTSGKCSNGYFNCPEVLKYPSINEILACQLARKLQKNGVGLVDWVIGSPYSGITFSYEVAKALGAVHGFAEKDPTDPSGKKMVWRRMTIPQDAVVLQVEELITSGGTFQEIRRAVEKGNKYPVKFLPLIGALVHRPPCLPTEYSGRKIVALIEKEIWAVNPPCELCKKGSPQLRPKAHWKELTRKEN